MDADRRAPVFAEGSIEIASTPERLWDLMADLEAWPRWNPDVTEIVVDGPLREGTVFRWKGGSTRIVSTLQVVDRPRELAWTGRTFGIRAIHSWRFTTGPLGAVASMEESFAGGPTRLMRSRLQRQLDAATEHGLQALKTEAERG
jgi:hypothetical protein